MKRTFSGSAVDRARKAGGLTFRELAARIGCTEHSVHNWAKGRAQPGADQLAALADALEIDMNKLFRKGKGGAK